MATDLTKTKKSCGAYHRHLRNTEIKIVEVIDNAEEPSRNIKLQALGAS